MLGCELDADAMTGTSRACTCTPQGRYGKQATAITLRLVGGVNQHAGALLVGLAIDACVCSQGQGKEAACRQGRP